MFTANIGSLQGDSLSPVHLNCYYKSAMKAIRPHFPPVPELDASRNMPRETQYADDLDFLSHSAEHLEAVLNVALENLTEWNPKVNPDKTERVRCHVTMMLMLNHGRHLSHSDPYFKLNLTSTTVYVKQQL